MKTIYKNSLLIALLFAISGCSETTTSNPGSAINSSSSALESPPMSLASSFNPTADKEQGLTLESFNEVVNALPARTARKVRYTYHIVEKLVGTYSKNGLEPGEYVADLVVETRTDSSDTALTLVSGTATTQMQRFYASNYSSAIDVSGWLSYHAQRRTFKNQAQEGEGFEERFYTNPMKLWMISWGNRPSNATSVEGEYFAYQEYERTYDANGYCLSFMNKEYESMKGTITSSNNGTQTFDGYYEITCNCSLQYLN